MNSVVYGFQLGCFVDHKFGSRYLTAIVQPGGDMQFFPLIFTETEVGQRPLPLFTCSMGQHFGDHRNPLTVSSGVRRFGIDGAGNKLDKGIEQLFLLLD